MSLPLSFSLVLLLLSPGRELQPPGRHARRTREEGVVVLVFVVHSACLSPSPFVADSLVGRAERKSEGSPKKTEFRTGREGGNNKATTYKGVSSASPIRQRVLDSKRLLRGEFVSFQAARRSTSDRRGERRERARELRRERKKSAKRKRRRAREKRARKEEGKRLFFFTVAGIIECRRRSRSLDSLERKASARRGASQQQRAE